MSEGSSPHSVQDDIEAVRWALKGYQLPLALEALARLEEQYEVMEENLKAYQRTILKLKEQLEALYEAVSLLPRPDLRSGSPYADGVRNSDLGIVWNAMDRSPHPKLIVCSNCGHPLGEHCTKHYEPCCPGHCSGSKREPQSWGDDDA